MRVVSFAVAAAAAIIACGPTTSGNPISCYVATQNICYEDDAPSSDQTQNLQVKCSSVSGAYAASAACPESGYVGKCTYAASDGTETDRYYTGTDTTYQSDFCQTVDHGVWSTAF